MNKTPARGHLLVALPTLLDPNFRRTVVLICEHGPEGSMGLVVNRPLEVEVSQLVLEEFPILTGTGKLFSGGPVGKDSLVILRRGPGAPEGHPILHDVHLAQDFELFRDAESLGEDEDIRCFSGYAGWGADQLETELKSGAWELLDGDSTLVFDADPTVLWNEMIRRIGGPWSVYADMAPDPSMN